jgi:hypothetical protein
MYQSVGTALPPLIAQAMGLPHYSGIIHGKPVEQGMEYGSRERGGEGSGKEGDETEDLTALLRTVMVRFMRCYADTRLRILKLRPFLLGPSCRTTSGCGSSTSASALG